MWDNNISNNNHIEKFKTDYAVFPLVITVLCQEQMVMTVHICS